MFRRRSDFDGEQRFPHRPRLCSALLHFSLEIVNRLLCPTSLASWIQPGTLSLASGVDPSVATDPVPCQAGPHQCQAGSDRRHCSSQYLAGQALVESFDNSETIETVEVLVRIYKLKQDDNNLSDAIISATNSQLQRRQET